ncbi:MAG: 30S ribosomal protein S15 [Candidatus Micrarchaeia archaeon]
MARMHSGKHGKSKSRKPIIDKNAQANPEITKEQIINEIIAYAKQGIPPALIGENLKKEYAGKNVPYLRYFLGKKLGKVLEENNLWPEIPPDLLDLIKKAVNIRAHLEKNKQDQRNKLNLKRIEAKIWRLTKYYTRTGKLETTWRYNPEQAALLIKNNS